MIFFLQDALSIHRGTEELGAIKGIVTKIYVKINSARRQKAQLKLERLLKAGIIKLVKFSEWADPVVPH